MHWVHLLSGRPEVQILLGTAPEPVGFGFFIIFGGESIADRTGNDGFDSGNGKTG